MLEVERQRRLVARGKGARLYPADHARAAAEGNDGRFSAARPVEDRRHVGGVARIGDKVGRRGVVAEQAAHRIGVGLAVAMGGAVVSLARAELRQGGRRRQARRAEGDLREPRRGRRLLEFLHAEELAVAREGEALLFGGQPLAFAAPAEMLQARFRHPRLPGSTSGPLAAVVLRGL